jgi:hypothetical protein
MNSEGKVVIVTGAASGIGKAIAMELAKRKSILALCDVDEGGLKESFKQLEKNSPDSLYMKCDVTDDKEVKDFCKTVLERYGRIDMLLNIAGIGQGGLIEDSSLEDVYRDNNVCFYGAVRFIHEVLPIMIKQGEGLILNMSSTAAIIHAPFMTAYTSTKCAVLGYSEGLSHEVKERGVHVGVLLPGFIRTEMWNRIDFNRLKMSESLLNLLKSFLEASYPLMTSSKEAAKIVVEKAIVKEISRVIVTKHAIERLIYKMSQSFPRLTQKAVSFGYSLASRKGGIMESFLWLAVRFLETQVP